MDQACRAMVESFNAKWVVVVDVDFYCTNFLCKIDFLVEWITKKELKFSTIALSIVFGKLVFL